MNCCSSNKKPNPKPAEGNGDMVNHHANHEGHEGGHGKMMWLMMLMCVAPVLLVFFNNAGINKGYAVLFLLVCIAGHFIIMKFMSGRK